jgi:ORF6N domain
MKYDPLALQTERRIPVIRQHRIMLDYDLAALYGVETRALKQAVRHNLDRFPADFMFELVGDEVAAMVSQNVIPGRGKLGGARPMAFTEQGVAMLSSVLHSPRAVQLNIAISQEVTASLGAVQWTRPLAEIARGPPSRPPPQQAGVHSKATICL